MIVHDVKQNSPEWSLLRAGTPTASCFKMLVTSTGLPSKSLNGYAGLLAAELYAGKPLSSFKGNAWTDRGHEFEDDAANYYGFIRDCEPKKIGFVTDDDSRYGASPDRLINEAGLLEIKCLKTENHIKLMEFYDKNEYVPSEYVVQPQGQMLVCKREWCDIIFFHPHLPSVIVRQMPSDIIISELGKQLDRVITSRDEKLVMIKSFNEAA